MKPPLILKEKDFSAGNGIKNPSKELLENLRTDLIAVIDFLINFESDLKIDLGVFECENNVECGTYRCVAGWWAYWLGIPIRTPKIMGMTERFRDFHYANIELFQYFENTLYSDFFSSSGNLPERLKKAKSLIVIKNFPFFNFNNKLKK